MSARANPADFSPAFSLGEKAILRVPIIGNACTGAAHCTVGKPVVVVNRRTCGVKLCKPSHSRLTEYDGPPESRSIFGTTCTIFIAFAFCFACRFAYCFATVSLEHPCGRKPSPIPSSASKRDQCHPH